MGNLLQIVTFQISATLLELGLTSLVFLHVGVPAISLCVARTLTLTRTITPTLMPSPRSSSCTSGSPPLRPLARCALRRAYATRCVLAGATLYTSYTVCVTQMRTAQQRGQNDASKQSQAGSPRDSHATAPPRHARHLHVHTDVSAVPTPPG